MKACLVVITGFLLWHGDQAILAYEKSQPIPRPIIRVEQANARTLLQCTPQGMREYLFACKSRERMAKVRVKK